MLRIGTLLTALFVATPALAETNRDCASDNHPVAIRACTQLINRDPRNATAYYNRGISYRETGKIDLALADYNRAIEINPRYFEAYNNRGNIFMARGDNRRALQEFDQAVTINPRYAVAHNNRGEAFENMSRTRRRDGGLQPGDRDQSTLCTGLCQPRRHLAQEGSAGECNRRLPICLEP